MAQQNPVTDMMKVAPPTPDTTLESSNCQQSRHLHGHAKHLQCARHAKREYKVRKCPERRQVNPNTF